MDKKIIKFIKAHHVLTLATAKNNIPHTSNVFYAFDETNYNLYISSESNTKHIADGIENPNVAINIVLETKIIGKIQGMQGDGLLYKAEDEEYKTAKKSFIGRFPYTMVMDLNLWVIKLNRVKFTDNRLGFGKKLHWNREQ